MSGMSKHTPGPWRVVGTTVQAGEYRAQSHAIIADCSDFNLDKKEREANAHLIAAAPEMLEALKDIVSTLFQECQPDRGDLFSKIDDIARPAIAKAEGKS